MLGMDRKHHWNILGLTLLSQALIIGIHSFSFAFWIVPWLEEFRVPRSELMLIISLSVLGAAIVSPFAGLALDRVSMRTLFTSGAVVFSGTLLLISQANSHWMIMLLYATLLPIGLMLCGPLGSQTLVARWFKTHRGFALGISALGISVGSFLLPLIVTSLLPNYGWRTTFQLLAVASFILLVPASLIILRKQPEEIPQDAPNDEQNPAGIPQSQWTTASLLRNRDFWIVVAGFGALQIAYNPILFSLGSYANDLGITQRHAALAASLGAVSLAVGKLIFGKLADRIEHQHLYWIASGLTATGICLLSFAESFIQLVFGLLITTFAIGSFFPLLTSIAVARFGSAALGRVTGLAGLFIQLSAVSPFLTALIRDTTGGFGLAFLAMLTPLLPAALAMRWLSRPTTRPHD